ncbi:hypothetical protein FC62_GL001478 [Amylolactobacillus amylotrophicus DSM 20534]|uniref:Uncharacterized protein n=4 Tax=Amylolactobacillus TaxID=2767876 RepID=A0A0R1YWR3_9LACO|nr:MULTISPECIES: hypothetical protein [Amylolactobacillus]APT18815.1 hypothetical protein LA20533_05880 [Amylolactobacillus amylophilus DSM 20533 = JCM 1125]KRK37135.1 hypothetical protein FC62_GL001478 [Amylolactobacillus amylotrophicus DSM 20534]KRM43452.1 hypothetical protein FD40_GL000038 [Amylolactobacillus amylophilus DSM 20533 = JCM 1125]GED80834.1 hypothetical protein LAM01_13070 [Amylolactobacillus amylophilus]
MANYNENNRQSLNRPTTPKKRKPLDKVTDWISTNGMIILVVGLVIILLMSASRTLGWAALIAGMILIYIMAQTQPEEKESKLNRRLSTQVDFLGQRVGAGIEERVAAPENPSPERQKIDRRVGGLNLNLLVLFLAAITLVLVFYGPFASAYVLVGIESKSSIYQTSLTIAQIGLNAGILSYGFLTIVIGAPIMIILLTLSKKRRSRLWAFILSALESVVLIVVMASLIYIMNTVEEGKLVSMFSAKLADVLSMTVGFGISSYLLLVSSLITSVVTALNNKK